MYFTGNCIKSSALVFLLILTSMAVAQRIILNSNGERIVMYPDGTWRLAEPADSSLMRQYLHPGTDIRSGSEDLNQKKERNTGEEQEFILRQWNQLYANILAEEKKVQSNFRKATNAQFKAGEQHRNAEANKKLMEPMVLASLQNEFKRCVNNLKTAKLHQKEIKKVIEKANKLNAKSSKINAKSLQSFKSYYNQYLTTFAPERKLLDNPPSSKPIPSAPVFHEEKKSSENYKPVQPVTEKRKHDEPMAADNIPIYRRLSAYSSHLPECNYSRDTTDAANGRRKIELQPAQLFTHTDVDLRPYFKDKELITCRGYLSKIGPYIYLNLHFQIASSHSQSNFGSLQTGSLLRFKLLNGDYVSLNNLKSDKGRIDPYSGHTLFSGQYALGKEEIKALTKSELDKMRVLWATGYEDYEVYNIDFLLNQLHCLMSKK